MSVIGIIVCSTREGRFSEKVASWISAELSARQEVQAKLLDLRDYPLPFFDQPVPPGMPGRQAYDNPIVQKWTAQIGNCDGFIFVCPEYNHSIPGVLKNALDWVCEEWHRKAAAFVSWGGVGGGRAIEHLRGIATALHLAPSFTAVHLPFPTLMAHFQGGDVSAALEQSKQSATTMIDDLLWWTVTLKGARLGAS
jgi:NAD(P)H-dependent FMN reductase